MELYSSVVGIDPSLTGCAVAVLPRRAAREFGDPILHLTKTRATPAKKGAPKVEPSWADRQRRILYVARQVLAVVPPEATVFIEAPAYSSNMGSAFDRYRLWEQIVERLQRQYCTVVPVLPNHRAMWATGVGNPSKEDVIRNIAAKFPTLDITWRGKADDNLADAVALMALGADVVGDPIAPTITDGARAAVKYTAESMEYSANGPITWQTQLSSSGKWTAPNL
ncbi:RuvC-like Holliday junction resolvase [Rhodococcus phage ReqiPine5]|uniref:Gp08 n=1 Tax=Rhodococcus phage ReqiPine5 TaxID=691963 RepID=D4P7Y3_9CAUD|nr:RuvC-like Holliday junction resolvase [Rhodococcus phage ReqiPine5]ADD81113.1 gp08 [Rhodococcus phage ReqiPine5]